mmetsp:Transcript_1007/g.2349  ORF Transcript_1007/g.2349 Transcript_1007/m.2349 type:complete len:289 (+) Transcript_1007:352-1218(+)
MEASRRNKASGGNRIPGLVASPGGVPYDEFLFCQRGELSHHVPEFVVRVVDHDVEARDHVVLSRERFEVRRDEGRLRDIRLGPVRARGAEPALCFRHHRAGDVARCHLRPFECERDGKASRAAARIAHRGALDAFGCSRGEPRDRLLDRLRVAVPDVLLDVVDVLRAIVIDATPPLESLPFEVRCNGLHLDATGLRCHFLPTLLGIRRGPERHEGRCADACNRRRAQKTLWQKAPCSDDASATMRPPWNRCHRRARTRERLSATSPRGGGGTERRRRPWRFRRHVSHR